MSYLVSPKKIGPPVDWTTCLHCHMKMGAEEERYRIELGSRIGIGHRECQEELLGLIIAVKARAV